MHRHFVEGLSDPWCTLESLVVTELDWEFVNPMLVNQLPQISCLKEFEFRSLREISSDFMRLSKFDWPHVLRAVEGNRSLQTIRFLETSRYVDPTIPFLETDWSGWRSFLDASQTTQLTKVCDRNRGLNRAIENPEFFPIEWWHAWWKRIDKDSRELGMLVCCTQSSLHSYKDM
jgi:hypothetical protein